MTVKPVNKPLIGILAALVYIAIMGAGMMYLGHKGIVYGSPDMFGTFWPIMILLNVINVVFVIRFFGWRNVGFGKLEAKRLIWLAPFAALLLYKWVVSLEAMSAFPLSSPNWSTFAFFGFVTLLIGTGEELAFRGILLHSLLGEQPTRTRVALAMFASAVGFSLLHSVNVFGGEPLPDMLNQLGYTFRWGMMFAPLMLHLRNIIPLMIVHWLFDFVQFSTLISEDVAILAHDNLQGPIEIVTALVLWYVVLKNVGKGGSANA
jgi:membrane protease YdiL (CAAX protease family)